MSRGQPPSGRLLSELASVAAGLAAGARYVFKRRGAAAALGATGGFSFLFGPLFLMSILLYRDYFYRSSVGTAEGHVGGLVVASGIGYACAALITPPVTRRLSKPAWITLLLLASAVVTITLGETFIEVAYLAIGFCLYLTRQGVAICATTILQEEVDDAYRGRVFAFYDMMFNVAVRHRRRIERGLHAARRPLPGHHRPGGGRIRDRSGRILAGQRPPSASSSSSSGSGSSGGSAGSIPSLSAAQRRSS